jgi:hypothetical protein
MGQGAELSVPNSQGMNAGQAAKAESQGGAASQPPRGGNSTEQRSGEGHKAESGAGGRGG